MLHCGCLVAYQIIQLTVPLGDAVLKEGVEHKIKMQLRSLRMRIQQVNFYGLWCEFVQFGQLLADVD